MDFHLPKKKIFSAVLCGALMLSASVPAFAFSDSSIASSVFEETQMAVEQAVAESVCAQALGSGCRQ